MGRAAIGVSVSSSIFAMKKEFDFNLVLSFLNLSLNFFIPIKDKSGFLLNFN